MIGRNFSMFVMISSATLTLVSSCSNEILAKTVHFKVMFSSAMLYWPTVCEYFSFGVYFHMLTVCCDTLVQ